MGTVTDQEREIIDRCRTLGIDRHGLRSIRNFIDAAFYHVRLPGTLPADIHVALNTAIRRASNRIACQGRHGDSRSMSRMLSRKALALREEVLLSQSIPPALKLTTWRTAVTEEHQEPVLAVQEWIEGQLDKVTVDDVVLRLLVHPSVIVTREEERRIPVAYRRRGHPEERYREAKIERVLVEQGTAAFFGSHLRPGRIRRSGLYDVERLAFEE